MSLPRQPFCGEARVVLAFVQEVRRADSVSIVAYLAS